MQAVMVENILNHLKVASEHIFFDNMVPVVISSPSGSYQFAGLIEPFEWVVSQARNFLFLTGVPILVLAVVGLVYPGWKEFRMAAAVFCGVLPFVILVGTYWPWPVFLGYLFYYSALGFFILATAGIRNLAFAAEKSASLFRVSEKNVLWTSLAAATGTLLVIVVYTNQDILFGYYIEHLRHHRVYFLNYPYDWNFDMLDW
jgi:hypothetical protein